MPATSSRSGRKHKRGKDSSKSTKKSSLNNEDSITAASAVSLSATSLVDDDTSLPLSDSENGSSVFNTSYSFTASNNSLLGLYDQGSVDTVHHEPSTSDDQLDDQPLSYKISHHPPSLPLNIPLTPNLVDPKLYATSSPKLDHHHQMDTVLDEPQATVNTSTHKVHLAQVLDELKSTLECRKATHRPLESSSKQQVVVGKFDPTTERVTISHPNGIMLTRMGQAGPNNQRILWPEEASFLMKIGGLLLHDEDGPSAHHALLAGHLVGGVSVHDVALAYSELKKSGYIIARAGCGFVYEPKQPNFDTNMLGLDMPVMDRMGKLVKVLSHRCTLSDLVRNLVYLYISILFKLAILFIPSRLLQKSTGLAERVGLYKPRPTWHLDVWKPMQQFKTTCPGPPDFIVTVVPHGQQVQVPVPLAKGLSVPPPPQQLVALVENAAVHFYRMSELGNEKGL